LHGLVYDRAMPRADPLEWSDLRVFLRAAQARTLAGAARALSVEHTTVGRRLTALEKALGAPLVVRGPAGLELTSLGQKVLPLVEGVERAVHQVQKVAAQQQARVRLAVPSGFTGIFTPHLGRLRERRPGLELELVSGARPVDLKKGEADLAIRIGTITDPELVTRKLGTSGSALFASREYLARKPAPKNPENLAGHELIGFDVTLSHVPSAQWLDAHAQGAAYVLRSREMTDMVQACVAGAGLALVPCNLGDAEPKLKRVSGLLTERPIWLVYRKEARLNDGVRAVSQFVVEVMREHAALMAGA
jgi:DNA-binding transcriptional LysR family regulator